MKNHPKYEKAKLIAVVVMLAVFSYSVYYRFAYTRNERIVQYFEQNEQRFEALKDELIRVLQQENGGYRYDFVPGDITEDIRRLQKKLGVSSMGASTGLVNKLKLVFYVDFGNYIGVVEYIYNDEEIEVYTDRDGFGVLPINQHWGYQGRTEEKTPFYDGF